MWREDDVIDDRYKVVGLAGRGAMGEVYQVKHLQWGIDLAVKIPRSDIALSNGELEQFAAEAQTWVSLGLHPNICCCHFVRQIDGLPVVFAEYVPGGSLHTWIAERRLYAGSANETALRVVDVAIQFAWGLAYAHQRHLVHQDVKPANVMIDQHGDDLTVKVTDFGLARARPSRRVMVAEQDTIMVSNSGMTPAYASPEQIDGLAVNQRTDVYSYAVSVLEMLTARPRETGTQAARVLAGLPGIPAALVALLEPCLSPDPDRRPSMTEIVDELTRIYREQSGTDYPRQMPDAANMMADEFNNRALSMLDLGDGTAAEGLFGQALGADPRSLAATYNFGLLLWRRGAITDLELLARIEALQADSDDPERLRDLLGQVRTERGANEIADGSDNEADAEWRVPWPVYPGHDDMRRRNDPRGREGARDVFLDFPHDPREPPPRIGPRDDAALAMTPDGRLALAGTWDGTMQLWDVRTGRCLKTLHGHHKQVSAVDLTPDGRFALSADEAGVICFWDLRQDTRAPGRTITDPVRAGMYLAGIALSHDGHVAFWATADGHLCMMDTGTGEILTCRERHAAGARAVRVSRSGDWIISSGWELPEFRARDDTVRIWHLRHGYQNILRGHSSWVTAMAFSADAQFVVTGSHDRTIRLWNRADGTCVRTMRGHTADALCLSDDMHYLLSGDVFDGTVRLWDVTAGRCLRTVAGHENGAAVVHFDPAGQAGFSIGHDRTVRRWALQTSRRAPFFVSRPRSPVQLNQFDSRVSALVSEAEQATAQQRYADAIALLTQARSVPGYERHPRVIQQWRTLERRCVRTRLREAWSPLVLTGHTQGAYTADISGDGQLAVSGGNDGTIRVWELDTGVCTQVLEGHGDRVLSVCLSPDADTLLSSGRDGTIRLWDVRTGACLRVLHAEAAPVHSKTRGFARNGLQAPAIDSMAVRFAADGQQAVVGDPCGDIRIWDLDSGSLVRSLRTSTGRDLSVAADGRLAAFARGDLVQLWDLRRGNRVRSLPAEFLHSMHAVCLSAGGRLALTSETEGIRLWNTSSGSVMRTFSDHDRLADGPDQNRMIAMTADGRFAVSAGFGSFARVWDLFTGDRVRELDGVEPGLTCLAMTPDGTRLLCGTHAGFLRLWELDWELRADEADEAAPPSAWAWDDTEEEDMAAPEPDEEVKTLLLGFRPEADRVIAARDNPDLARYVIVTVPGVGTGPEQLSELLNRAEFLRYQLQGVIKDRVSVIIWLDYPAPQTPRDAHDGAPAAAAGTRLAEFIDELRVTSKRGNQVRITVVGHGYGGLVAGHAARHQMLDADALVFFGSAAAGVTKASDLRVTGTVYATSSDAAGDGTPEGIHGPRPDSPGFGATILRSTPLRYGDDPLVPFLQPLANVIFGLS